jgi:exosome complex component CSL4
MEKGGVVFPGQRVAHGEDGRAGDGVRSSGAYLVATRVGVAAVRDDGEAGRTWEVRAVDGRATAGVVPRIGDEVTARVVRITPRLAAVEILCVGSTAALTEPFAGVVRAQDVRAAETAKVEMHRAFRPGDVLRAEVLSTGDARSFFLTTAKNHLGVVFARSQAGCSMLPIGWNQMQCPRTRAVEPRKVAGRRPPSPKAESARAPADVVSL